MKKHYLILPILMIAVSLFNFSLDIDSNGHYFTNGAICGVGLTLLYNRVMEMRKMKQQNQS